MTLSHMALAILLSGLAVSMTDWFFFGVLFHDKYRAYPEIWRQAPADVDGKADAYMAGRLTLQITEVMSSDGGPPPVKASTVSWMPRTTSAALLCRWDLMNSRALPAPNCPSSLLAASVTPSVNNTRASP